MPLAEIGEFGFIAQIRKQFSTSQAFVSLGIGDDAAAFKPGRGIYGLLTTDTLISGTHFSRNYSSFEQVGMKAVAVNLSDIAAMGGRPRAFLISLGIPDDMALPDLKQLYRGIAKAGRAANIALIGGNTTCTQGPFFISITLYGEVVKNQMIRRSGAKPGDAIYVTGTLGDAAAGLDCLKKGRAIRGNTALIRRHRLPKARTVEGPIIVRAGASSMIDLSDGLTADLNHVLIQSGVGAALDLSRIPLSPALKRYAKQNKVSALDFALYGGEDYELLFSVPENKEKKLKHLIKTGRIQATRIGTILLKREGMRIRAADGSTRKIVPKGYDHFSTGRRT